MQGAFRAPADATIRLTYDPTGGASTSDWVISEGDEWASFDAMVADWNAQLESDLGAATLTLSVTVSGFKGLISVAASLNYSVAWSHAGDGSAVRDWFGESADITNQAAGAWGSTKTHKAGWYVDQTYGGLHHSSQPVSQTRPGRRRSFLSGGFQGQHDSDPGDTNDAVFPLRWEFQETTADHFGNAGFIDFVTEHLDQSGALPVFSVFHGGVNSPYVCRWQTHPIDYEARPVLEGLPDQQWSLSFDVELSA